MFVTRNARSKSPAGQVYGAAVNWVPAFAGMTALWNFFVFSCLFPYAQSVKKPRFFYALDLNFFKIANPLILRNKKILIFWKKVLTLNLGFFTREPRGFPRVLTGLYAH